MLLTTHDGTVARMGQLTMTTAEREAFLAEPHIGVLAIERVDGPPLTAPIWYRYDGGVIEMTVAADSHKARALRTAGRASLCAQREGTTPAYVTVEGPVTVAAATRELRLAIATRYLGAELGEAYVASTDGGDSTALVLTPQTWRTVEYAKLNPRG
jgi:PPOX class probable F420-dependent enzyme